MRMFLGWLLLATPTLAVPVSLPPGEDRAAWDAVLERSGLAAIPAEGGAWVRLEAGRDGWWLQVRDTAGAEHRVAVVAPTDDAAREDLVWLAASLLRPLRPPGGAVRDVAPSLGPPSAPPADAAGVAAIPSNPRPASSALRQVAPPPPPPVAETLPPAVRPAVPAVVEPAEGPLAEAGLAVVASPTEVGSEAGDLAPGPPAAEGEARGALEPAADRGGGQESSSDRARRRPPLGVGAWLGAVARRDCALGLDVGMAAGLRAGAWQPEIGLKLRPTVALALGEANLEVRSLDLGIGLQAPRLGARGPRAGLALGASRRAFSQDGALLATGWAPTLGLAVAQPLRLGTTWSLAPTLTGARDLRRVAYRWPDGATQDHPAWELSGTLALTWAGGE